MQRPSSPVFVISLSDDDLRRKTIGSRLNALGIAFTFFDAVDGRRGLDPSLEHLVDRHVTVGNGRSLTDPEYACALSHRAVYQHVLDNDLSGVVILEDDAVPGPRLRSFVDAEGHRRGDLVLLDHGQCIPSPVGFWHMRDVGFGLRVMNIPNYATGYSVSQRGAERLLKANTPVKGVADWPINLRHLEAYALFPRAVKRPKPGTGSSWIETQRAKAFEEVRKSAR